VRVGSYNPLSATLFSFIGEGVTYNDGTNQVPSNRWTIDEPDCPADEDDADDFQNGVMIMYVVVLLILGITIAVSILTWRRWKAFEF
jgi:hypothetical protein